MSKVDSISTLQELREAIGRQAVDKIFTEYMMELVAKGLLMDTIDIEDIKELL